MCCVSLFAQLRIGYAYRLESCEDPVYMDIAAYCTLLVMLCAPHSYGRFTQ